MSVHVKLRLDEGKLLEALRQTMGGCITEVRRYEDVGVIEVEMSSRAARKIAREIRDEWRERKIG